VGNRADLYILDKRKKSLGLSGNPYAERLARSVVNISIMPFHVPFLMVLLYIMLFIELCGLYLKIDVVLVLKLHAMKIQVARRSGQTFTSQVIFEGGGGGGL